MQSFIDLSRKKHGNKFNYEHVIYVNRETNITIICNDCDKIINILAKSHIKGAGCIFCNNKNNFFNKCRKKYNNNFNYDKSLYVNSITPVIIFCNKCQIEFNQTPNNHLTGIGGCPKCLIIYQHNRFKSNINEFLIKAREIHGDKYDYSKSIYITSKDKMSIRCITHDFIFNQTPHHHLRGANCPKCVLILMSNIKKSNTPEFIVKAKAKHAEKYDYSQCVYVDAGKKIIIRCIKHDNIFEQSPAHHLSGAGGCMLCLKDRMSIKFTKEEFIHIAKLKHGDKYDYEHSIYNGTTENITIRCIRHNTFFTQLACSHTSSGQGCSICAHEEVAIINTLTTTEYINNCKIRYGNKFKYDNTIYNGYKSIINIVCNTCNNELIIRAKCHYYTGKCIYCAPKSKGEIIMGNILNDNNIKFKKEFHFVNDRKRYDFLLTDLNIFVEIDGIQHFTYVEHWHKDLEKFEKSKQVDAHKTIKAINNNYKMIRIDYTIKTKEDIEKYFFDAMEKIKNYNLILSSDIYIELIQMLNKEKNITYNILT